MGCRKQSQGVANSKSGPKAQDPNKTEEKQKKKEKMVEMSTRRFKPVPSHSSDSRTCQLSHTCACNTYLTLNLYELKLNGKTKQKRRGINTQPLVFYSI
jgi:hypothetical protein